MAEIEFVAFAAWSVISAIIFVVVGLVYKKYLRRHKDEPSSR